MFEVSKGGEFIGVYCADSSGEAIRSAIDHAENMQVELPSGRWEAWEAAGVATFGGLDESL